MPSAPKLRWTAGYGARQSHCQHHCMYPQWSASTTAREECLHPFLPNITVRMFGKNRNCLYHASKCSSQAWTTYHSWNTMIEQRPQREKAWCSRPRNNSGHKPTLCYSSYLSVGLCVDGLPKGIKKLGSQSNKIYTLAGMFLVSVLKDWFFFFFKNFTIALYIMNLGMGTFSWMIQFLKLTFKNFSQSLVRFCSHS